MNRYQVLSSHYDTLTLAVEKLEHLEALCRVLWQREKTKVPTERCRLALMRCATIQAGQWCDRFEVDARELAFEVEQCRHQNDGGGCDVAADMEGHKNSLAVAIEVCTQVQNLCSELVNDKPSGALARLAFDVADEAIFDFESIENIDYQLLQGSTVSNKETGPTKATVNTLVDRIASLYSGKALPNDPTELRITGHDVYLAQKAKAELGGGV